MFIVPVSRSAHSFARRFDRLFDQGFERLALPAEHEDSRLPALDVVETATGYRAQLEIPGVAKEDVKVSIEGRLVTVQAQGPSAAKPVDGEQLIYSERTPLRFVRTFKLPLEVDQAESGAKLENGVLSLSLHKRVLAGAGQITVN